MIFLGANELRVENSVLIIDASSVEAELPLLDVRYVVHRWDVDYLSGSLAEGWQARHEYLIFSTKPAKLIAHFQTARMPWAEIGADRELLQATGAKTERCEIHGEEFRGLKYGGTEIEHLHYAFLTNEILPSWLELLTEQRSGIEYLIWAGVPCESVARIAAKGIDSIPDPYDRAPPLRLNLGLAPSPSKEAVSDAINRSGVSQSRAFAHKKVEAALGEEVKCYVPPPESHQIRINFVEDIKPL